MLALNIPLDFNMNNTIVVIIISLISLVLGLIKYSSLAKAYKSSPWQLKFIEIWNDFINFFIPGLIGYYFVLIRWPLILNGQSLNTSDLFLLIVFLIGLFGHLCVLSNNFTEGIRAIVDKYFKG